MNGYGRYHAHISKAQPYGTWAKELYPPVSIEESEKRMAEPSMGNRHHLCAHRQELHVPYGHHRRVLQEIMVWGLFNSLEAGASLVVVWDAIAAHGCLELLNSEQGSQFTCKEYI